MLGIELAQDYATTGHLYIFATYEGTDPDAATIRLSRFTVDDPADPTTLTDETTVLDGIPVYIGAHAGGAIVVDPSDGTLFVAIGDTSHYLFADPRSLGAQDPDDPHGKLLHISPDGSGVSTNPFYDPTSPERVAQSDLRVRSP